MAINTFSNRLSTSDFPTRKAPIGNSSGLSVSGRTPFSTAVNNVASGIRTPQPSTPLKSTTTKNIDGSTVTHQYHAPDFSKGLKINSSGQLETPSKIPGIGFLPTPGQSTMSNTTNPEPTQSVVQKPNQPIVPTGPQEATQSAPQPTPPPTPSQTTSQSTPQPSSMYAGLISQALKAQNEATNYQRNLGENLNAIENNPNYSLDTQVGRAAGVANTGALQLENLTKKATNLSDIAGKVAPVTQFGVLTDPTTGLPISGGSAGSAAFQGGVIGGQQAAGVNYANMSVANTAAKGIENTITQYLQQNPSLNPSELTVGNKLSQWIQSGQFGDPKYQTLGAYLNEYISTLAPILGVGGDTTNLKTEIAQSMINAAASGKSISEVLKNISKLADDKLANIGSAGQGGGVVAGGTSGQMFGSFF